MFHKQRHRLLRNEPWTADQLAQELHTMFGPDVPLDHKGPISLQRDGTHPLFDVRDFNTGDILISVTQGNRHIGDFVLGESGPQWVPEGGAQQPQVITVAGGGGIPGTVLSGTGSTYQVRLFENGISEDATKTVSVTQRQIAGEAIPPDTAVVVFRGNDGVYWMQAPVWM